MSEAPPGTTALALEGVTRTFAQAGGKLEVLRGVDLAIAPGELVALVGPSGAGKSTLLQIAGLLEPPTSGRVLVGGVDAHEGGEGRRTGLRGRSIGFVYQFHHLLPEFSAEENVAMPLRIAGQSARAAKERARALLERVGLGHRLDHRPARLSGGEQQRVAIARALANRPRLLLADEPTGNLDPDTADGVFALLVELVRGEGLGALVATHNPEIAARMDRVMVMSEGRLVQR